MRPAATTAFLSMTVDLEGRCTWPYCDKLGKVTTGLGYLCDSIEALQELPWTQPNGSDATLEEIAEAFTTLKAHPELWPHGGATHAMQALTTIRLSNHDVDYLTIGRMGDDEDVLRKRLDNFDALCCDAQMGTMSIAWACGPWFAFPKFLAALAQQDFVTAAAECYMPPEHNPGNDLTRRNAVTKKLFLAAVTAVDPAVVTGWP